MKPGAERNEPNFIGCGTALEAAEALNGWLNSTKVEAPNWPVDGMTARVIQAVLDQILTDERERASLHRYYEVIPSKIKIRLGITDISAKALKIAELRRALDWQLPTLLKYSRNECLKGCPYIHISGGKGGRPAASGGEKGLTSIRFYVGWVSHLELDEEAEQGIVVAEPVGIVTQLVDSLLAGAGTPAENDAIVDGDVTSLTGGLESMVSTGSDMQALDAQKGRELNNTENGSSVIEDSVVLQVGAIEDREVVYSIAEAKRTFLGRLLFPRERVPTTSWRWRAYRLSTLASMLFGLLLGLTGFLVMYFSKSLSGQEYFQMTVVIFTGVVVLFWMSGEKLKKLARDRIAIASEWWVGFDRSSQVELIRTSATTSDVQLVRYTAQCAVCGAEVDVVDGRGEFSGRLVGRCIESPREHVFTFDRVTRFGRRVSV